MDKGRALYHDALALLDLAANAPNAYQRAALLSVAVCIRNHARDRFGDTSAAWPPDGALPPSRAGDARAAHLPD